MTAVEFLLQPEAGWRLHMYLGEDFLGWIVLALGSAMSVGTIFALLRPRPVGAAKESDLPRPPMFRSVIMIAVGTVAAIWALASLVAN